MFDYSLTSVGLSYVLSIKQLEVLNKNLCKNLLVFGNLQVTTLMPQTTMLKILKKETAVLMRIILFFSLHGLKKSHIWGIHQSLG